MAPKVKLYPRYPELTAEHERKIDELITIIKKEYNPMPNRLARLIEHSRSDAATLQNNWRLVAYAYLVSRDWNVSEAFKMVKTSMVNRAALHLDESNPFPSAFAFRGWDEGDVQRQFSLAPPRPKGRVDTVSAGVIPYLSVGMHYWDKEGLPVLYLMIGRIDEEGLINKLDEMANIGQKRGDVMWELLSHAMCAGEFITLYQQHSCKHGALKEEGIGMDDGLIHSITVIVDATGLSYKMLWKPATDLFQECLSRLFSTFPDCINRIMVVNCPTMVRFAYSVVKGVLTDSVQKKVSFYSPSETAEALQVVIDVKHIPKFLGGECECAGNCVAGFDPHCKESTRGDGDLDGNSDVKTENISIMPWSSYHRNFEMTQGEQVVWEFVTAKGRDVTFSIYFTPAEAKVDKSSAILKEYLVSKDHPTEGADSYTATKNGTLVLVWGNKHSWFTSRSIQMKVFKQGGRNESSIS